MKAMSKKVLAIALAVATVFTMSSVSTVTANAATKSTVAINYTKTSAKKAAIKSVSVSIDGKKAAKSVNVYLTGKKSVKIYTDTTVTTTGKKAAVKKLKNYNKVTYKSSKSSVASVNSKGVITAKKTGKATITVASKANSKKKYAITVTVKKGVSSMTISPKATKATLTEGDTYTVKATVKNAKGVSAKKDVTVSSDDKSVATVKVGKPSKSGVSTVTITAKAAGTATIKIAPKYGSSKAKEIKVTVNEKPAPEVKYTKVVFADKTAKKVALKGKVTINVAKDSKAVASVEKLLAAIGGDYTVNVAGKTVEVKNGKAVQDLNKVLGKDTTRQDVTVECTKTIAEMLAMVENMKLTEDVAIDAKFSVIDDKIGEVSAISVTKAGEVKFTFAKTEFTAFVKGGELYLVGDQVALLKAITTVTNNSAVIKDFEAVYTEVR